MTLGARILRLIVPATVVLLSLNVLSPLRAQVSQSAPADLEQQLDEAYVCLSRFNACKTRWKSIELLENFYGQKRTIDIILALLGHDYTYSNPNYHPSRVAMDESDRMVARMARILGRNGDPRSFEVLLGIVIYPEWHRPETVTAAYDAMMKLKWEQWKPDAK